jgi:hypothetical protein
MIIEAIGPTIDDRQIEELEKEIDVHLPADYREFLLKNNGGAPVPDTIAVPGAPGMPTDVQTFFGIDRTVATSNLRWNFSMVEEYCLPPMLPIACDSGGNLFCFRIVDRAMRDVVYCDLSDGKIYPVADGFQNFLSRIRPYGH